MAYRPFLSRRFGTDTQDVADGSGTPPAPSLLSPAALLPLLPQYEYSEPITFGGPQTTIGQAYQLVPEFLGAYEFRLIAWVFGGAAQAILSLDNMAVPPALTATEDPTARVHGMVSIAAGAGFQNYSDTWVPVRTGAPLYLAVTAAGGNAVLATVQFRRRVSPVQVYSEGLP